MKWEDYKSEKLKNPDFKKAYDELEEEFNLLNEKLSAENKKILSVSNKESFKLKTSRLRRKKITSCKLKKIFSSLRAYFFFAKNNFRFAEIILLEF